MKVRGFEVVTEYKNKDINLPVRKTKNSAGYDVEAAEDVLVPSVYNLIKQGKEVKPTMVKTGLKAYCQDDEYYILANRSSNIKKRLMLANGIGIIDSDYYNSEETEGHFSFSFLNYGITDYLIKKHEAIGQVVFQKFLTVDGDNAKGTRKGGFGSTDK